MGITVHSLTTLPMEAVQYYFQLLYMHDRLQDRFMDISDPTWTDVIQVIQRIGKQMYMAVDDGVPVGEFTLEHAQGKACLIHFSLSPDITWKRGIYICRHCARLILTGWYNDDGSPFVQTLVGLTPTENRAACLTVLKAGFTKVGVIPHAAYFAQYQTTGPCMASILTREMIHGWERPAAAASAKRDRNEERAAVVCT